MVSNSDVTQKKKGVSIINKELPSFGSDKQLEASIGKQVRLAATFESIVIIGKYVFKN